MPVDSTQASFLSCGGVPSCDSPSIFAERLETIEALCDGQLSVSREWHVHLWQKGVHRALAFCPKRVDNFEIPIVAEVATDDSSYTEAVRVCQGDTLETLEWAVVLELFVDSCGDFSLRVGVLYGFEPTDDEYTSLGFSRKLPLVTPGDGSLAVAGLALHVIAPYTRYGVVGTNCQHFAREFGGELHLSELALAVLRPQDEAMLQALSASSGGLVVGGAVASKTAAATVTTFSLKPAWGVFGWLGLKTKVACVTAAHGTAYCAAAGASGAVVGATVVSAASYGGYVGLQHSQRGGCYCCCGGRTQSIR